MLKNSEGVAALEFAVVTPILFLILMLGADFLVYVNAREATAALAHTACTAGGRYLVPTSTGFVTSQSKTAALDAAQEAFDAAKPSAFIQSSSTATLSVTVTPDGMKLSCSVSSETDPLFGISLDHMGFTAYAAG